MSFGSLRKKTEQQQGILYLWFMKLGVFPYTLLFFAIALNACEMQNTGTDDAVSGQDFSGNVARVAEIKFSDYTYHPSIHTVIFSRIGDEISQPITMLGGDPLMLHFDDFETSIKDLYYQVIHCNADWQPSGLMEQEYLDGFPTYNITNYRRSFNSYQNYVHYSLQIPNEYTKIKRSGNYLLKVFANNDQERVLLTRRFQVYENLAPINAVLKRPSNPEDRQYKQEIDLVINVAQLNVPDVFSDIKIVIRQNGRWDNMVHNIKPMFVRDGELVYDLDEPNTFNGGNEFRYFNTKTLNFNNANIAKILRDTVPYEVVLFNDEKRSYKKYITAYDINGMYQVTTDLGSDPHTESDYYRVYFFLPFDQPLDSGAVYIYGALSDWQVKPEYKMNYNFRTGRYEHNLLLKQGFYNYQYVLVNNKQRWPDETAVEGSHFDTENDYHIFVYFRDIRTNCDRLVGYRKINSVKN